MNFLKGMILGLAGFLLFIVLFAFGLAFAVNGTVLNPEFTIAEIGKLGVNAEARPILYDLVPDELKNYTSSIDETLVELKPWTDQQIDSVINGVYDYVSGKTSNIDVVIPTDAFKKSLQTNFTKAFLQSPPPEYQRLSSTDKSLYLSQAQQKFINSIPATIEINRDFLGPDVMQILDQLRPVFGYIRTGYFILLIAGIVLALVIALMLREIKGITRSLGIIFLASGAFGCILFFILKQIASAMFPLGDLSSQMQTWAFQLINDVLSPLGVFNLVLLGGGVILLVASFIVPSRQQSGAKVETA